MDDNYLLKATESTGCDGGVVQILVGGVLWDGWQNCNVIDIYVGTL